MAWEFIKAFAASNKVKTLPQEPDQGPPEHPEPLSPAHQLQPFIDKISIVITPPDEEQAHLSYKAIMLMATSPRFSSMRDLRRSGANSNSQNGYR